MSANDINLPPLRHPQVPRIDADIDLADLRRLVDWCEKTARSYARAAVRAALQSQDREEVIEMALCESRKLVLRIGQTYRFVPVDGCNTCEEMKAEHDQAYAIDTARRAEGGGE